MTAALITVGKAALLLGVAPDTVARYLDEGKLQGIILPSGHRRIRQDSVDDLLAGADLGGGAA